MSGIPSRVLLITIPHTGTHWLRWGLQQEGYQINPPSNIESMIWKPTVYQAHSRPGELPYYKSMLTKGYPLIAPIRHPYRIELSHLRRYSGAYGNGGEDVNWLISEMELFMSHQHDHIIPLDTGNKKQAYELMKDELNFKNQPNFEVIKGGQSDTARVQIQDIKPSKEMEAFVRSTKDYWERWYNTY